ncbi:MAG: type I-B CRISPR-associated protein Cas7/Cst2/DevR [Bacillota bacterium]
MAFVTGLLLIDAPASALNNLGSVQGARTDNTSGVKYIRTKEGAYPYVSAQSFRYWLRTTLENNELGWIAAPIFREEKVAYTDANPILYWDDDLFGYMRAPSKKVKDKMEHDGATPTDETVTRISPFRVGTFVSISPVNIVEDFGVMSRHEGDPVPFEHQFYRTTLKGLFSLNLNASGTFWYRNKTGFKNLDDKRKEQAGKNNLEHLMEEKAYRLKTEDRINRISTLFEGLARLEGGAKQALHYTDVSPVIVVMGVTKGGNHIFNHTIGSNAKGLPELKVDSLNEVMKVFKDDLLSCIYVGWVKGYREEELDKLLQISSQEKPVEIKIGHPREAFQSFINDLRNPNNALWLE